ncbi:MAG TPA: DUF4421 family protein [Bacteroidia bacterium]|nr:DUF4421 family protein [Bacteroidia bacterium]
MKKIILLFFLINSVALKAQHDSTYFKKYSHKLALGFFSTLRNYNLRINSNISKDAGLPDVDFATNGRLQWGLAFGYDKIRLGIAIGKSANNDIYGQSRTQNIAADIGGNAIFIAVGYRRYTGMYDKNSTGYMPANGPTFYIDPSCIFSIIKNMLLALHTWQISDK